MASEEDPIQSCQLIGLVGIMVQLLLGGLSFSVLIYKRYTERPKRAWKIWFLDTSKQGVSQFLAHIINIIISIQLSANIESDACIWYLTTNVLDNTVGVFLCIGALSLIEKHLFTPNYTRFQSGNYYSVLSEYEQEKTYGGNIIIEGDQHMRSLQITHRKLRYAISYWDWVVQFIVWNGIVVVSKTMLFYIQLALSTPIIDISLFLIGWIQPYQTLELILVIIVVPVIMNGLAFWIQDNFLKKKDMTPVSVETFLTSEKEKKEMSTSDGPCESNMVPRPEITDPLL